MREILKVSTSNAVCRFGDHSLVKSESQALRGRRHQQHVVSRWYSEFSSRLRLHLVLYQIREVRARKCWSRRRCRSSEDTICDATRAKKLTRPEVQLGRFVRETFARSFTSFRINGEGTGGILHAKTSIFYHLYQSVSCILFHSTYRYNGEPARHSKSASHPV